MSEERDEAENDTIAHELVTVATFHTPIEAELARTRLEAAGIASFLSNAASVGVMPFLGNDLGGIGLQVSSTDADAAREILGIA